MVVLAVVPAVVPMVGDGPAVVQMVAVDTGNALAADRGKVRRLVVDVVRTAARRVAEGTVARRAALPTCG